MQHSIGVTTDGDEIVYTFEGASRKLIPLLSALIVKFSREMAKVEGTEEKWIDVITMTAKKALEEDWI